jgi:hypothetical protein
MGKAMYLRVLAAAAVLVSAAVHLKVWVDGYRDLDVIGPAFMVNVVAGVVIAVLLVTWRHWIPLLLAAGFGAATLAAFITAATVGLFGVHEIWVSTTGITAGVAEIVALVAALWELQREFPWRSEDGLGERLHLRHAALH